MRMLYFIVIMFEVCGLVFIITGRFLLFFL